VTFRAARALWQTLLWPALAMVPVAGLSQGLPPTGLWLAELVDGLPGPPVLVSRHGGYNNQPMFSPDGRVVYFTAERAPGQTDIAEFAIGTGRLDWVNESPESEYSPTPIPGEDALSVIRVELPDQRQRLWRIPLSGAPARLLLPNVEPVGYHGWIDDRTVAVFILGDRFDLHVARIGNEPSTAVAGNIGRTIRSHPDSDAILFVDKNPEPWSIAALDPGSGKRSSVIPLFPGVEDFDVDREGRFWMGSGSKLYRSGPGNRAWKLAIDLRAWGITAITRLAVSPSMAHIAIVSGR